MSCIKEFRNNDCYKQEILYQKGKLHIRYFSVIVIILIIIGISLGLGNDTAFSGQISLASTISSIILSSIAIFMSISGETKNSYIQNQMTETSAKLSTVAIEFGDISNEISNTLETQLEELSKIVKDDLSNVRGNMEIVKEKIENISAFGNAPCSDSESTLSSDEIVRVYKGIHINKKDQQLVSEMLEYVLVILNKNTNQKSISKAEVFHYMEEKRGSEYQLESLTIFWGMILIFSRLGIKQKNKEDVEKLLSAVRENMSDDHSDEIIEHHREYSDE